MDYKKEALIRREIAGFVPFSEDEKKRIFKNYTSEELTEYYAKERLYNYVNTIIPSDINSKQKSYPLIRTLLGLNRVFVDHQHYSIIGDKSIISERPVVYAITHIGKFDYQIITEALNNQTYAFSGDPEQMFGTFDGYFMDKSGVMYCDTNDLLDRYISEESAVRLINHGANLLIYPEGVWNLTPNLLVLPLWPGTIRIAQRAHVDIVPVAIEQYGHKFIINIGKNIKITNFDEKNSEYVDFMKEKLRDTLASLKYEIISSRKTFKREKLGNFEELKSNYENLRLNEWKDSQKRNIYSMKIVNDRTYRETDRETSSIVGEKVFYSSPSEAFNFISNLDINPSNAFLLRRDFSLASSIEKEKERLINGNIVNGADKVRKIC